VVAAVQAAGAVKVLGLVVLAAASTAATPQGRVPLVKETQAVRRAQLAAAAVKVRLETLTVRVTAVTVPPTTTRVQP
jgi:hypothetical protein